MASPAPENCMETDGMQPGIQDASKPFTFTARLNYPNEKYATIVKRSLEVDPELRPQAVRRALSVDGTTLILHFAAIDMRTLRAAVGTFCDLLGLATRTLEAFGPAAEAAEAAAAAAAEETAAGGAVAAVHAGQQVPEQEQHVHAQQQQ